MTMVLSGDRTISAGGPNGQQERLLCVALFCSKRVPHSLRAYLHKLDTFVFSVHAFVQYRCRLDQKNIAQSQTPRTVT